MATADELLAETTEPLEVLYANLSTRVISIPASVGVLGVESDDDVKRLRFNVPRHYGDHDLSEFDIRINFQNARGGGDFYPVDDIEVSDTDDTISFSWLVDRSAFRYSGDVKFSICMKKYNDEGVVVKELNTTIASLPVLKGLETSKEVVEENPSAFDAVLFRLYAVEAATGLGKNGYYSIVNVNESEQGALFTIINQDGTTVATVRNGRDGYSPVKGLDYWTEEDETEIKTEAVNHALGYIDNWAPKVELVTLRTSEWDSSKQQTIVVDGVTENNIVVSCPEPSYENYLEYGNRGVRCIAQDTNQLTFECRIIPNVDLNVYVAVFYSASALEKPEPIFVVDNGDGDVTISGIGNPETLPSAEDFSF